MQLEELFKSCGFLKHSDTAWICHGDTKTHIIDCIGPDNYRKVKILHRQAEDGSFCSATGTKIEMLTRDNVYDWLQEKYENKCKK